MTEFVKNEKTGKMYCPVVEAYNILASYMDGTEDNEGFVIEEALGSLAEALSD